MCGGGGGGGGGCARARRVLRIVFRTGFFTLLMIIIINYFIYIYLFDYAKYMHTGTTGMLVIPPASLSFSFLDSCLRCQKTNKHSFEPFRVWPSSVTVRY